MRSWFGRVLVATALVFFVVFAARPAVSYQALDLGASPAELALVVACFPLIGLFLCLPIGRQLDRRGQLPFLCGGTVAMLVPLLVLLIVPNIIGLAIASAILGATQLVVAISAQTLIARGQDEIRRDSRFATFTVVTSTAQFGAPAVAGLVISAGSDGGIGGNDLVFLGALVLVVVAALLSLSLLVRPGALSRRPTPGEPPPAREAVAEVCRSPVVVVAIIVGFSVISAADLLVAFMPVYGEARGIPPHQVGFLIASHGLASIAVRLVLTRVLRSVGRRTLLLSSLLLAAGALACVPFVHGTPILYVLMVLSGLGIGVCQPVAITWLVSAVRSEVRGTALSVRMVGNRLGQLAVPLGVAALAGSLGLAAAFVLPALLLASAGALVRRTGPTD